VTHGRQRKMALGFARGLFNILGLFASEARSFMIGHLPVIDGGVTALKTFVKPETIR